MADLFQAEGGRAPWAGDLAGEGTILRLDGRGAPSQSPLAAGRRHHTSGPWSHGARGAHPQ